MRIQVRFWLLTLAAVVGIATTAALGHWQLGRAAQKEALHSAIEMRGQMPVLGASSLAVSGAPADLEAVVHRSVLLQGRWLPAFTVYLDNRQMQGRPGFFVLTPLQLEGSATVVLVQRGWVPRNFQDRTALPALDTPAGAVQVQGRIAAPPSKLFEFDAAPVAAGSSRIRQNLDWAAYRAETGLALADASVLQTGAASEGLQRDWPAIDSGIQKHYGYAFQWFGLSSLIALLYVWFQIVRPLRSRRRRAA